MVCCLYKTKGGEGSKSTIFEVKDGLFYDFEYS
jgi:hypothetical protein